MSHHHATVIFTTDVLSYTVDFESSEEQHSNFFEKLGIDEVRKLSEEAHRRPTEGFQKKCIFTKSNFITIEAQQALLKVIEEPPESCRFVFVFPIGMTLLPTIISRVVIHSESETSAEEPNFVELVSFSYADRLAAIDKAIKAKDTAWQRSIKSGLIHHLRLQTNSSASVLSDLDFVARNLLTRGASNKFLLEHLALTLPIK